MSLRREGTKMLMNIFMPSTPAVLLAIAVLAVLVILAWFVGGTAPIRHVARQPDADSRNAGEEPSSMKTAASTKKAA